MPDSNEPEKEQVRLQGTKTQDEQVQSKQETSGHHNDRNDCDDAEESTDDQVKCNRKRTDNNYVVLSDVNVNSGMEDKVVQVDESHELDVEAEICSLMSNAGQTLPPLSEVHAGEFTIAVTELIQKKSDITTPNFEHFSYLSNATTEKCAWWFAKCERELVDIEEPRFTVLESLPSCGGSDAGSLESFAGNVSNHEAEAVGKECQVNEISSTSYGCGAPRERDPDKVDEFCVSTSNGDFCINIC